jgi:EAL domain-containing protein (putative c-di-GMP-specific phosphodiesterase class I)
VERAVANDSKVAVNVALAQLKESFIGDVELARKITSGLRALGVLLAVDDFGSGYSLLSQIKLFPITCFKIGKSFVDAVPGNVADVAIVRTILALDSSFNVEIGTEGDESLEQMEFLGERGVINIQGFYFAQPMPPDVLVEWRG